MSLINNILEEWAYRVDNGMPNPKNSKHLAELALVLSEMGMGNIKDELIRNLMEADDETFTATKKDTGETAVFKSKEARDAAVKAGTHIMSKGEKEEPQKVTSAPKITDKVKKKIENWTEKEKAFFDRNEGAPGSKERRSLGQALKDKAAGALKAIKKGAMHEVEEFKAAGRISREAKQRQKGIWVLAAVQMPAVLVETGFISNPEDEDYLNSDEGQNQICEVITKSIIRYKNSLENQKKTNTN